MSLVTQWNFEKPFGDRLSSSGMFLTLKDEGAVLADKMGDKLAAKFSGSNDLKIANADMGPLKAPTAFSFAFWFRSDSLASASETLLAHFNMTGAQRAYWVNFEGQNNLLRFSVSSDGTSTAGTTYASAELTGVYANGHAKELWKHCVVTYENNTAKLVLNGGERIAKASKTQSGVFASSADFYVGKDQGGRNFQGSIAELSFWDHALSDAEIRECYEFGVD